MAADVILRAVGVEWDLGAIENPQEVGLAGVEAGQQAIEGNEAGAAPEDIVAGVQSAVASRIASMAGRKVEQPIVFTGGVALVSGMAHALSNALGSPVSIAPTPQLTGALGAAIIAATRIP